jgi:GntR family transcriptional regulator
MLDRVNLLCILCLYFMFVISQTDKRPMYLQIMEQIKQRIAVGDWMAGRAIPSIRGLAVDIGVSVITVKRAYLELEREGVIVTHQGKGSFVASDSKLGTRIREQELAQQLEQAARNAALLGLSPKELERRIRASYDRVTDAEKESV